jgi:hypothetical protein
VVVNASGILRESGRQTFEAVHVLAPTAVAQACIDAGIKTFVQISALGEIDDGEFIASKHRFDEILLRMPLRAVVLRPSVVYATSGSYGGTSLLRALAALPGVSVLPGDGRWPIQPVCAEDLADLVAIAVAGDQQGVYEIGGPEPLSLRAYQMSWRRWLRIAGTRFFCVPEFLVGWQVRLGERIGRGPVGTTLWRMLRRGNTTQAGALSRVRSDFGIMPRSLADVLARRPAQVQDRWQAQLYFLSPILRVAIILLWLMSALAGWFAPAEEIEALTQGPLMLGLPAVPLARAMGMLDLVLAAWLATGWRPRWVIGLMGLCVGGYTVAFGILLPPLWMDPLGGLAKNLLILPALAVAWVLAERR